MKRFFALFFGLLFVAGLTAQVPFLEDLTPKERREYRRAIKDAERRADNARDDWDIVLDPIETTPIFVDGARAADFSNWGNTLLRGELASRMVAECAYPVIVKIADTGSAYNHPDLTTGILPGSQYTTEQGVFPDGHGHSTHVAGIVGGKVGGLAWPLVQSGRVRIEPVQVLGTSGSGSFTWVANALNGERAEDNTLRSQGVRVVYNFSLGGGNSLVGAVETAAKASVEAGAVLVAAAGNNGGPVSYPGLSEWFICVSAIDQNSKIASFSNRGAQVDFTAPGVGINSTYKGSYAALSGTSMAAPFVTALSAIAISKWGPKLPNQSAVMAYLARIATDLGQAGRDDFFGNGLVFVKAILDTDPASGGGNPPPPPPPVEPETTSVTATFSGPFAMRYRRESEQDWSILIVSEFSATITGEETPDALFSILEKNIRGYFPNRGIVLTDVMSYTDAVYWTGQFAEYAFKQAGLRIQVSGVTGHSESGARHSESVFDKADDTRARSLNSPQLQIIKL